MHHSDHGDKYFKSVHNVVLLDQLIYKRIKEVGVIDLTHEGNSERLTYRKRSSELAESLQKVCKQISTQIYCGSGESPRHYQ